MATKLRATVEKYAKTPSEVELEQTRDILKPPGIMSNNYNKQGLKKVERPFISAKDATTTSTLDLMRQTNYQPPMESTENISYFSTTTKTSPKSIYDRINHVHEGYNQKLHRDDRQHAKSRGLYLYEEENGRKVPATLNAIYGHPNRSYLERSSKQHGHVEICRQDFYRVSGVNIFNEE